MELLQNIPVGVIALVIVMREMFGFFKDIDFGKRFFTGNGHDSNQRPPDLSQVREQIEEIYKERPLEVALRKFSDTLESQNRILQKMLEEFDSTRRDFRRLEEEIRIISTRTVLKT